MTISNDSQMRSSIKQINQQDFYKIYLIADHNYNLITWFQSYGNGGKLNLAPELSLLNSSGTSLFDTSVASNNVYNIANGQMVARQ